MNEEILQNMSRALTHLNNRMYTYLSACFAGDEIELEKLDKTINFLAKYYGKDWDKAEKMEILMDL